jgi:hypothetical protein
LRFSSFVSGLSAAKPSPVHFDEATLIRAGRAFQQVTEWHLQRADLSAWEGALAGGRR